MTAARPPQLGSVIWAELADANGFRKVRPAVVITPTTDIASGRTLRVLAITTRVPRPLPDDHVLLPRDRQGKVRSGLRKSCAAVTSWQAEIALSDVQQVAGVLPSAIITKLLSKLAAGIPFPTPKDEGASDDTVTNPPTESTS